SGSGQTVGTALYVCDDLPDRLRRDAGAHRLVNGTNGVHKNGSNGVHVNGSNGVHLNGTNGKPGPRPPQTWRCTRGVRLPAAAAAGPPARPADPVALPRAAGEACLTGDGRPREEVDLVIHTGVYRPEFLSEPALAAIAAGELGLNHDDETLGARRTFAFDLMNGAAGTLTGCLVAAQRIDAGGFTRSLVITSEIENKPEG